MGQDQEKKYVCKWCNKSFSRGKMLGGHIRIHGAKIPMKEEVKLRNSNMGFESYGLRENPKKSWKFSSLKHNDGASAQGSVQCRVCGKEFESPRSLHGHLRHHTPQERKRIYCRECGRGFLSIKSRANHIKQHAEKKFKALSESISSSDRDLVVMTLSDTETVKLVRRKRSQRTRYTMGPNSSCSSLNESVSGFEIEKEMEEVAMSLMMLSRGVCNFDGSNSFHQSKGIEEDEGEDISDDVVKIKKPRVEKSDSDIAEDSGKKSEFKCKICNKKFPTYQSLGGHQTFHRTTKSCFSLKIDNFQEDIQTKISPEIEATSKLAKLEPVQDSVEQEKDRVTVESYESKKVKEHKCAICFKNFVSGQALGGHKRCHLAKAREEETNAMKQEVVDVPDVFYINLPYMLDEEANHDVEVKSWWVRGAKNESIGGSSC